jgi:hypothetical protein
VAGRRESLNAMARFEAKSPLTGTPSWVKPNYCLQVLGTDKDGAVALPRGQRRLVLLEYKGLGWVAGMRERQRAVARFEVKSPLVVNPS